MKKNLQTWGNGLIKALKASEGIVAVLWYAIEGIKNIVTATGNLTNHEKLADFRSYQSLLEEVKEKLNTITKFENYEDRQTKLIILVDEIDRCLPNEQLIVLERVHHLFEVKNCFVIISLNQKSIVSTINTLYGINGFEYLRKFFNLTFKLKTSVEIYFLNMLNDLLAGIAKTHKEIQEFVSAARGAYECILHGDRKVIRLINNRDLTQYFENLNQVLVSFDLERITPKYLFFIIIAFFIQNVL